jgi:signal transduction histidine kinase/CheY-like chemotaxis protein
MAQPFLSFLYQCNNARCRENVKTRHVTAAYCAPPYSTVATIWLSHLEFIMPASSLTPFSAPQPPRFAGAGTPVRELVQAHRWEDTPLGPMAAWPVALRTTVGIVMHAVQPMFLWWGEQLIQIYNDAYVPCFGAGKHPAALGQAGRECWPEIWSIIGPQIEAVRNGGEARWYADKLVPIWRNGRLEDVYWSYTHTPVFDEQGQVGGVLVVCTETTAQVLAERRRHTLDLLARRLLGCRSEAQVHAAIAQSAIDNPDDLLQVKLLADGEAEHAATGLLVIRGAELHLCAELALGFGLSPRLPLDRPYRQFLEQFTATVCATLSRLQSDREVDHLARLVDDLTEVSRIASGKVELRKQTVALADVLNQAIKATRPLLEQKQHRLLVDVPTLRWHGDPERLAQVVANLLSNAARYTPPGGHVTLATRIKGDTLQIQVTDDGNGIAPSLLPHIFELFVQGSRQPDRARGGLGLGLALVHKLVQMHGGDVSAYSAGEGRGSTFTVTLPDSVVGEAASPEANASSTLPVAGEGATVLVVDDNQDAADLLGELLGALGYRAAIAYDPVQALALAADSMPQVAILDIGLPGMDGFELAGHLRQLNGGAALKLVALSGYGQENDKSRSRQAGFASHLVKPVNLADLQESLS